MGISGGADSTALLVALAELPSSVRPRLVAAHLDHGLRPADGAADAQMARALAARYQVPFHAGRAPVDPAARTSIEAAARNCRYAFLADTARRYGCVRIAVGHHRDDQLETVLFRLLRGSGAAGLGGFAPRAPGPWAPAGDGHTERWDAPGSECASGLASSQGVYGVNAELQLVRPLFFATRDDVLAFLHARGLTWREDPSNTDQRFVRNRLRLRVLPTIQDVLGPGAAAGISRAADNLRDDAAALRYFAGEAVARRMSGHSLSVEGWRDMERPVRLALLRAWWEAVGGGLSPHRDHLIQIDRLPEGGELALPGGLRVRRRGANLVREMAASPSGVPAGWTGTLPVPGALVLAGVGRVTAGLAERSAITATGWGDGRSRAVGDAATIARPLRLRSARPGERIAVLGAQGRRSVRGLLASTGVSPECRGYPFVLEDAAGTVLWVVGARQTPALRLQPGTREALVLRWEPA